MPHLNIAEAVPLGYAMVARVAEDAGVRALIIKGPRSHELGLRPRREVVDVDVLVEPEFTGGLIEGLVECGWTKAPLSVGAQIMQLHSVQLRHKYWPMEIDVHGYFPGFLASPIEVFDLLWRDRQSWLAAGRRVAVPNLVGAVAIEALHLLRDSNTPAGRLEHLKNPALSRLDELVSLADVTGARVPLAPFLASMGVGEPTTPNVRVDPSLESAWQLRSTVGHLPVVPALFELSEARLADKPRIILRLIFLPGWEVLGQSPDLVGAKFGLMRAHIRRWVRGARALPEAWASIRTLRR